MRPFDHPSELSLDERLRELSSILAAGVLRHRNLCLVAKQSAEISPKTHAESAAEGLDLLGKTVLSVLSG
jgi:hypothetical protein